MYLSSRKNELITIFEDGNVQKYFLRKDYNIKDMRNKDIRFIF